MGYINVPEYVIFESKINKDDLKQFTRHTFVKRNVLMDALFLLIVLVGLFQYYLIGGILNYVFISTGTLLMVTFPFFYRWSISKVNNIDGDPIEFQFEENGFRKIVQRNNKKDNSDDNIKILRDIFSRFAKNFKGV